MCIPFFDFCGRSENLLSIISQNIVQRRVDTRWSERFKAVILLHRGIPDVGGALNELCGKKEIKETRVQARGILNAI